MANDVAAPTVDGAVEDQKHNTPGQNTALDSGWDSGVRRRVGGLAGARGVMQIMSLGWFVFAAQKMSEFQFGLMASALAIVVLLGALGDVGLSRTIVFAVAGRPLRLWPAFRQAMKLRLTSGVVLSTLGLAIVTVFDLEVSVALFAAAAATAFVGGVSEIVFAALRAIGRVGVESIVVIVERVAFLGIAIPLVLQGRGALAVMTVYAATNMASATWGVWQVVTASDRGSQERVTLMDGTGWSTALSSSLVSIGFRIGALVLIVIATPEAVGLFSIGQRAPESLALLGLAAGGPVLAMARHHVVHGNYHRAMTTTMTVVVTLLTVSAPLFAWFVVRPKSFLDLLFNAGNRPGANRVLVLLAAAGGLWIIRLVGETMLLSGGRAAYYSKALLVGLGLNLATAAMLIPGRGAVGAAEASLIAEVAVLAMVLKPLDFRGQHDTFRNAMIASTIAISAGTTLVLSPSNSSYGDLVIVGLWSLVAAAAGWRMLRAIDDDSGSAIRS